MQTTTIRLDDSLKDRVTVAAEQAGKLVHAFILQAKIIRQLPDQAIGAQVQPLTAALTRIEMAPEVFDDFDIFFAHIAQFGVDSPPKRIGETTLIAAAHHWQLSGGSIFWF